MGCPHCGADVEEGTHFCEQCGKPLSSAAPLVPQPTPKVVKTEPLGLAVEREPQPRVQHEVVVPEVGPRPLPTKNARKGRPEVILSHWFNTLDGFQTSAMAFYESVRQAIERREIPKVEMSLVEWHESGMFSAKRAYLRVKREDYVFDICAAPYGTGFFFSWWLGQSLNINIGSILAIVGVPFIVFILVGYYVGFGTGFLVGFFAWLGLVITLGPQALESIDHLLLKLPYIGPFYEQFLRPLTYYRIDTAVMFRGVVHSSVLEVIDELTKTKGLRALTELERKPVMRGFLER